MNTDDKAGDTGPQSGFDPKAGAETGPTVWRRSLPLAGLVGIAALLWFSGLTDYLTLKSIADHRDLLMQFVVDNYSLALLAYAAIYVVMIASSLPGGVFLTILGGFLFGWFVGGLVTVAAATLGATIVFLIAKTAMGEILAAKAGPLMEKLRGGFQRDSMNYLLFLRLVPVFPFWLVNLAPALLGMKFWPYVIGTFIGIIPGTFAFAFAGAGLDSIITAQSAAYQKCLSAKAGASANSECTFTLDPGSLLTKEIIVAFVALGLISLLPVVLKRWRSPGN